MALCRILRDRALLRVRGVDRVRFLHGMVTQDIEALRPGQGCHAALLTTKGRLVADLFVFADEEELLVECGANVQKKVHDHLSRHLVMDDAEIVEAAEGPACAFYGEDAADVIARAVAAPLRELALFEHVRVGHARVCRVRELQMPSFHVYSLAIEGEPISSQEYEILRVEAGLPIYGVDMDEDRLLLEAGLDDAVSFTKGCYLGQEVIARATHRGHINRKLVGLFLDGDDTAKPGTPLSAPSRAEAGVITSSVVSKRFGAIALGYVHRTLWTEGTELVAQGRGARVTQLPFCQKF